MTGSHTEGGLMQCLTAKAGAEHYRHITERERWEQQAQMGFDEEGGQGGRASGCGEGVHGALFAQQLAAGGLQDLVGLLVSGDLNASGGVGEPNGIERHAGYRLAEITTAGGEELVENKVLFNSELFTVHELTYRQQYTKSLQRN